MQLCRNIELTKGQHAVLRSKSSAKEFLYALMGMLWTCEVLCNHSITGKSSNAFKEKDAKPALDQDKVKSLCGQVLSIFNMTTTLGTSLTSIQFAKVQTPVYKNV